jgi:hypothetical protein|tara:strand:+ start:115 stop:738 length:624 start_codon:yes stop_codon:yes gene_type:complete
MIDSNNPIINYSKSLRGRTPGNSYKDILHIGNNGSGVDDTSPIHIFDGNGTWTGISLSKEEINLDLGNGRLRNAVLSGSRFSLQNIEVNDHSDIFLNLHECSYFTIRQTEPLPFPYGLEYNSRIFLNFTSDSDESILLKGKIFIRNESDYDATIEFVTGSDNAIYGGGLRNEYSGPNLFIYDISCLYNVDGAKNSEFIVQLSDRIQV